MALTINITTAVISGDRFIIRGRITGISASESRNRMFILHYSLHPITRRGEHPTNAELGLKVVGAGGIISHEVEIPRYTGPGGPSRVVAIQDAMAATTNPVYKVFLNVELYDTVFNDVIARTKILQVVSEFR